MNVEEEDEEISEIAQGNDINEAENILSNGSQQMV